MLLQFKFKNYKSFAEEVVLHMTATSNKDYSDNLINSNGKRIFACYCFIWCKWKW